MSLENVKKFMDLAKNDENLAKRMVAMKNGLQEGEFSFKNDKEFVEKKILPLAKEFGIEFSAEDFMVVANLALSEMTDEDLQQVSGGFSAKSTVVGLLSLAALMAAPSAMDAVYKSMNVDFGVSHTASAATPEKDQREKLITARTELSKKLRDLDRSDERYSAGLKLLERADSISTDTYVTKNTKIALIKECLTEINAMDTRLSLDAAKITLNENLEQVDSADRQKGQTLIEKANSLLKENSTSLDDIKKCLDDINTINIKIFHKKLDAAKTALEENLKQSEHSDALFKEGQKLVEKARSILNPKESADITSVKECLAQTITIDIKISLKRLEKLGVADRIAASCDRFLNRTTESLDRRLVVLNVASDTLKKAIKVTTALLKHEKELEEDSLLRSDFWGKLGFLYDVADLIDCLSLHNGEQFRKRFDSHATFILNRIQLESTLKLLTKKVLSASPEQLAKVYKDFEEFEAKAAATCSLYHSEADEEDQNNVASLMEAADKILDAIKPSNNTLPTLSSIDQKINQKYFEKWQKSYQPKRNEILARAEEKRKEAAEMEAAEALAKTNQLQTDLQKQIDKVNKLPETLKDNNSKANYVHVPDPFDEYGGENFTIECNKTIEKIKQQIKEQKLDSAEFTLNILTSRIADFITRVERISKIDHEFRANQIAWANDPSQHYTPIYPPPVRKEKGHATKTSYMAASRFLSSWTSIVNHVFEALQKVNYKLNSFDRASRKSLMEDIEYIVSNMKNIDDEPKIPRSWVAGSSYGTGRHESSEKTKLKILAALYDKSKGKTVDLRALKTELEEREKLELKYDTHM